MWVNWKFVSWIVCALLRLLDERSRLQYRLKLTLQELEHLRSNEKRYESESAGMNNNSLSVSVSLSLSLSHTHTPLTVIACGRAWQIGCIRTVLCSSASCATAGREDDKLEEIR